MGLGGGVKWWNWVSLYRRKEQEEEGKREGKGKGKGKRNVPALMNVVGCVGSCAMHVTAESCAFGIMPTRFPWLCHRTGRSSRPSSVYTTSSAMSRGCSQTYK